MMIPTKKHITTTPLGQTWKATKQRKAIRAVAENSMHVAGIRDDSAKKKYDPYTS
jgi:hypothetical protein